MAFPKQVKQYLAGWFQLGKKAILAGDRAPFCPRTVYCGEEYSPEFEAGWQRMIAAPGSCYLEGTHQTIEDLLSAKWDISRCARCEMFVPVSTVGQSSAPCPCFDLPFWPNTEVPQPRPPVNTVEHLGRIRDRVRAFKVGSEE